MNEALKMTSKLEFLPEESQWLLDISHFWFWSEFTQSSGEIKLHMGPAMWVSLQQGWLLWVHEVYNLSTVTKTEHQLWYCTHQDLMGS